MAKMILVLGRPGTGKTHSTQFLYPDETFYINVLGKDLSFPGWRKKYKPFHSDNNPDGNYVETQNIQKIAGDISKPKCILSHIDKNMPHIKNVVIDDFNYLMSLPFMKRIKEKNWEKFNDIGYDINRIFHRILQLDRRDLRVFILCHTETESKNSFDSVEYMKTEGKAVRDHLDPEGLATVVLFTQVEYDDDKGRNDYGFLTQTQAGRLAKSPYGMFEDQVIPNNLNYVVNRMTAYYNGELEIEQQTD